MGAFPGQRFGLKLIGQVLRGSNTKKITEWNLDKLPVHGRGKFLNENQWKEIGRLQIGGVITLILFWLGMLLKEHGYLSEQAMKFATIYKLTAKAKTFLANQKTGVLLTLLSHATFLMFLVYCQLRPRPTTIPRQLPNALYLIFLKPWLKE